MELVVTEVTLIAIALTASLRRRTRVSIPRWLVITFVLASQLVLWLLRPSGLLVLYPWEYMFLYTPVLWLLYSVAKSLVVALLASWKRLLGLFLLVAVLLQLVASLTNLVLVPPPQRSVIRVCGRQLSAIVANTELRMSCGYYCWDNAESIVFSQPPRGHVEVTMIGITRPLLLIIAKNGVVLYSRLLMPWHAYSIEIPSHATIIETIITSLSVRPGCSAEIKAGT